MSILILARQEIFRYLIADLKNQEGQPKFISILTFDIQLIVQNPVLLHISENGFTLISFLKILNLFKGKSHPKTHSMHVRITKEGQWLLRHSALAYAVIDEIQKKHLEFANGEKIPVKAANGAEVQIALVGQLQEEATLKDQKKADSAD